MYRTLAPKNLEGLLGETYTIYKNNFFRFAAIVAIMLVPIFILYGIYIALMVVGVETTDISSNLYLLFILFIPILLAMLAGSAWMAGATIQAVAEQYFHQPVSIGQAYSFAWHRLGAMLGAVLLVSLALMGIYLAVILVGIIPTIAMGGSSTWIFPVIVVALIFVALPAIAYLGVNWCFVTQAALLENCGPISALSRSWALVKGSWWRVLGIILLLSFIMQAIQLMILMIFYIPAIIAMISGGASSAFTPYSAPEFPIGMMIGMIIAMIGAIIGLIISYPILLIGQTSLYFDLRVRKEGYSLDTLAGELGLRSSTTETTATSPPV